MIFIELLLSNTYILLIEIFIGIKLEFNIVYASIEKHLDLLSSQAHLAHLEFQMLKI